MIKNVIFEVIPRKMTTFAAEIIKTEEYGKIFIDGIAIRSGGAGAGDKQRDNCVPSWKALGWICE
jgi:hypothetical protein